MVGLQTAVGVVDYPDTFFFEAVVRDRAKAPSIHGPHSVVPAAVTAAVLCAGGLCLAATTTPRRAEREEQG